MIFTDMLMIDGWNIDDDDGGLCCEFNVRTTALVVVMRLLRNVLLPAMMAGATVLVFPGLLRELSTSVCAAREAL